MRPADVIRRGADYLARHEVDSPLATAELLMMHVLGADRAGLYARDEGLGAGEAKAYGRALCRRCVGTPLQHLTGVTGFRGLELIVRPGVFVPRPETEGLVSVALETVETKPTPVVVDVGTGGGAIALSIKHERPDAEVFATDVSQEAVALARDNANKLGLEIAVVHGDWLDPLPADLSFDLVVSNPPYVPWSEEPALPIEVRAEPARAIFGGPDVYRSLFMSASRRLQPGGVVVVEVHADAAGEVGELARAAGFEGVHVDQDLAGRDRVVWARRQ
jgi:release factor glutamine methyltransferase